MSVVSHVLFCHAVSYYKRLRYVLLYFEKINKKERNRKKKEFKKKERKTNKAKKRRLIVKICLK